MAKARKTYPASFKAKVALAALREEEPISKLSSKYKANAVTIQRWKKEALSSMEAGFSGKLEKANVDQEQEIHQLHAKIGQLTVERDFLVDASNRLGLGGVKK